MLLTVAGLSAVWYFAWEPLRPAFLSVEVLLARLASDVAQELPQRKPAGKRSNKRPAAPPKNANRADAARQSPDPAGAAAADPQVPRPRVAPPAEPHPESAQVVASPPESPEPPAAPVPGSAPRPLEPPPWQAALDATDAPPAALDVCFGEFDPGLFLPQADDVKKWFEPVAGQRWTVGNLRTKHGEAAAVEGLMRLRMPWRDDVALRLAVEKLSGFRIHFLHGEEGVTLAYYQRDQENCWVAYASRRRQDRARPEETAMAASDEGRAQRTGFVRDGGTFELRWRDGEVTLSRGDIALLRASLAGLPQEVLFEGKAVICGLAAVRSAGFAASEDEATAVSGGASPAQLPWTEKLTGEGRFERSPEGAVTLAADRATGAGWVTAPLPSAGIHEVLLEVDEATPGAGVFLGRQDGGPREVLRFVRNPVDKRVHLSLQTDAEAEVRVQPIDKTPVPLAPGKAWIRLLYGCGVLRWWTSCDGRHWAQPERAVSSLSGPVTTIGLHYVPRTADCRIRLRRLSFRRLPELSGLADAALLPRAPPLADAPHAGAWLTRAAESQPPEADVGAWRRTCAIRALGAGCSRTLGTSLLELLLDDAADRGLPTERQLALLNEAALLWDATSDQQFVENLLQRYRDLGLRAQGHRGLRPYSSIRRDLMTVPLVTPHRVQVANDPLIRAELIQLAHGCRWAEVRDFCRLLRYFRQSDICPLTRWAEGSGPPPVVGRRKWQRRATVSNDWQEPLIEELSKETYNAVAELNALLESAAFDDAARLIASLDGDLFQGVAPHVRDRQLLASLPTAVAMALDAYPEFRAAVQKHYGDTSLLRVRRAVQENRLAAIQLATVQFAGLPAAAEAHRWLGDRALSIGWFDHAMAQYRRAAESADAPTLLDLAARHRLAAAMLGREQGRPATAEIEIGGVQLTPAAFEELVGQVLKRNAPLPAEGAGNSALGQVVPRPSGFAVQPRSKLDGPVGGEPSAEVIPNVRRFDVDWAGRQIAVVLDRDAMYVSNRFQVAAYDANTGARVWQSPLPDGAPMRSQDWGLIRMRPLVTADRVITRLLYGQQPTVVCLDRSHGQLVWSVEFGAHEAPVSDPLWLQGRLAVLTLTRQETGESLLRWTILDPTSGSVVSQTELLRLNDVWWRRSCCEVTRRDDGFVAVLSGVTVCCDASGNLRWIRREMVLPPSNEQPPWVTQSFQPPLSAGNDLYVLQPGGCAVSRLDARSGQLAWSRLLVGAQRLLGVAGSRLIVQTDGGLRALAVDNGEPQWQHPLEQSLDAYLCDDTAVLYSCRRPAEDAPGKFRPQLVWVDAATGQSQEQTALRGLDHEAPLLGPLVTAGSRLWAFFGRGDQDPTRDVIELVPQGAADPAPAHYVPDLWTRHIPLPLQQETKRLLGDWRWFAAELAGAKPIEVNRWGEAESLGIRARRSAPATLARHTTLPAGSSPRLRIRVGNEPKESWNLEVRMNGAPVVRREFTAPTDPEPWKQLEFDLRPAAGDTGWLIIETRPREGQETADVFWKRVEIVF
ncbi:MAG: PQQ-binding-like beta-propeller repeat protein [Candidatus Anammoximicrobium sp.]|nr:PQQ-binding-like beta-propeller repeat protein [Candidatus Anammoximicrobium sp.]